MPIGSYATTVRRRALGIAAKIVKKSGQITAILAEMGKP